MKKVLIIIAILALMIIGWMRFNKSATKPVVSYPQTTPSVTSETNLEQELQTTEDDGGAVDFVELDNSAQGL